MSNEEDGYYEVTPQEAYVEGIKAVFALKGLDVVGVKEFQHHELVHIISVKLDVLGVPLFATWKKVELIPNIMEIVAQKAAQMIQLREQNNEQ